jgi:hypothetical protein
MADAEPSVLRKRGPVVRLVYRLIVSPIRIGYFQGQNMHRWADMYG